MKVLFLILLLSIPILAQSTELDRAIELYRGGNTASSLVILERLSKGEQKDDPRVWNYLGLAYAKLEDFDLAEKYLEKASKLAPKNSTILANYGFALMLRNRTKKAEDVLGKAIQADQNNASAYFLRSTSLNRQLKFNDALRDSEKAIALEPGFALAYSLTANNLVAIFGNEILGGAVPASKLDLLKRAIETLEKCIAVCGNNGEIDRQRARADGLKKTVDYFQKGKAFESENTTPNAASTPVKILFNPRPRYTEAARRGLVSGTIKVLVVFDADGVVREATILNSLGYGLDEEALRSAFGIRFTPATENGKAIAVVKLVEYSFQVF